MPDLRGQKIIHPDDVILGQRTAGQPAGFNLTNVFAQQPQANAAAAVPPGYAYFYGQVPGLQYPTYPPAAAAMTVPTAQGGTNNSQFPQQKTYGGSK